MKIGMNLQLWTARPTAKGHAHLLEQIKTWGFDGAEFPIAAMSAADVRELAKLADDLGLGRTTTLALAARHADPTSADLSLRRAALDAMKRGIDTTRSFGSELMAGPLFQGLGRFTGVPPTSVEWNRSVEVIREAAEYAASVNVRLALEPLNRFEMYMVNTIADGARFCREVGLPNVGLLADTHHSNIEEEHPAEVWAKQAQHIFHVHISENHRGIPGSGHAIPAEIFTALRRAGYDGWLTIEAFGPKVPELTARLHVWRPFFEREEEVAEQGLNYIRRQWAEAAGIEPKTCVKDRTNGR